MSLKELIVCPFVVSNFGASARSPLHAINLWSWKGGGVRDHSP